MSDVRANYQTIPYQFEAWFHAGQPYAEMPDWIRAKFNPEDMMRREAGRYAIRDEDGGFRRWMDADDFNRRFERIAP